MLLRSILILVYSSSLLVALDNNSLQDPDQFHVQTDEGDERYFLYQTHNGQYRKERRLKDGSVVGTTGWVDAAGYLRLQDYIADDKGYRIYKSKTVFVGADRPIGESMNIAKTAPTSSLFGITPAPPRSRTRVTVTKPVLPTVTIEPTKSFSAVVSITPTPLQTPIPTPRVVVTNPDGTSSTYDFRPITTETSTPLPNTYDYDSSNTNTIDDGYFGSDSIRLDVYNPNSYRHSDEWLRRQKPTSSHHIGDGYTPQFPVTYDGAPFRRNGFRYYLPKQYHEEDVDSDEKTGSFGYIDPFGIRRVTYYNSKPGSGFQVRKNNRYVGHDATPYDPRPIEIRSKDTK